MDDAAADARRSSRRGDATRRRVARRRRGALAGLAVAAFVAGALTAAGVGGPTERAGQTVRPKAAVSRPPELPGGGRRLFPDRRVVAAYGSPRDPQLGMLGVGTLRGAVARLDRQARPYARKTRPVLPALELIAVLATAAPGSDDLHRERLSAGVIDRHLRFARANDALLILDIQPGRADFLTESRLLERWLREPDVGLALDPEWHVGPQEVPGRVIGSTTAADLDAVSGWLADVARRGDLPDKLLLVHQFTDDMIRDKDQLSSRPGLAIVFNVDGFGGAAIKRAKYEQFAAQTRPGFHDGFKLFYEEDSGLMQPEEVLALRPPPDVVVYE